ncbi:hypothetical protein A0J48_005155 [Sphaerospermopsis aphanizomenoides BCCUSP55]|uniref:hypothetical protein n=1 Tax=Sphaerospermopsis aphanizomenoides TaxID=459663 RepID=UPI001903F0C2|nr:hypothetical protein [Sphaerospermopsis aphanizomenoides]MBK1986935.1 hypothetical protein [Sphaerospermopsis aphanizomenoides BCCUSP55]
MQFLKIVIVALVLLVNLVIAQPSWASKNFTKGADYVEVTQELNHLLQVQNTPEQAGYTPEQFQQRLLQLQSQKTIMETANKRAQCRNETGKTLAVYANKGKKYPTQLYYLADGQITDDDWDCDGLYLPAGIQIVLSPNGQPEQLTDAIAVKFVDGTQPVAQTNPTTGAIELNIEPAKIFKVGEGSWLIPSLSQAEIDQQIPSPQLID